MSVSDQSHGRVEKVSCNSPRAFGTELPLAISRMTINEGSRQPIYKQICEMFRAAITAGDLSPGLLVPTTHELAAALKITRNTVVRGYSRLVAEGYLVSNTRRGTRVAENPPSRASQLIRTGAAELEPTFERTVDGAVEVSFRARWMIEMEAANTPAWDVQMPDSSLYPRIKLGRLLSRELYLAPDAESGYGTQQFQEAVARLVRHHRGVKCEPEQVIPVQSLENALDLTSRALIDPGHCAYVENPTDPIVWHCLRAAGADVFPMPSDEYGADIARVSGPPARLIYVTPSVGLPFGRQMSEARREAISKAAFRSNAVIFECDRYSELLYSGHNLKAIRGLDCKDRVLYFGSLREALGPHLKAAYLIVPPNLVPSFARLSRRLDYGPEPFVLGALGKFLDDGNFVMHLKAVRNEYLRRLSFVSEMCGKYMRDAFVSEPLGGLTVALHYGEPVDEDAICDRTSSLNIAIAPLSRFYQPRSRQGPPGIVIGFGSIPERLAEPIIKRLAEVIEEVRSGTSARVAP